MQVQKKQLTDTKIELNITADMALLEKTKQSVLKQLSRQVKLHGFRPGKAPLGLVEKNIDQATLQSEFLDSAVNKMYGDALTQEQIRPVERPEVSIKKFVPFSTLEVTATVEALGTVKLPDYTKIKLAQKPVKLTDKDVTEVIESLRTRSAEKKEVTRAAKDGDEVLLDFAGSDAKTNDPIQGSDGKDYPLLLGSNSFIPGFEENVLGVKAGEEKTFTLTFPKDYGVKTLQNRKVIFKITVKTVNELGKPKLDDAFAAQAGPFKTLVELKADIKKQLTVERQNEADRAYESELVEKIVEQSQIAVPKTLVDEEIDRIENEERQNLVYRGQTWKEHLDEEGISAAEHREQKRPQAENRVKVSLLLWEVAQKEAISVTPDELDVRIQLLKGQYQDNQMRIELDKPENRQDVLNRMITEKTIAKLTTYAQSK